MRVAIAGAGAVGRSIAGELLENGHEILLIDKAPTAISVERVPQAEWLLADACEITSLDEAALQRCNVVIAATGDDKVNLVVSLLAKTEYGVPRVVARVNNPKNEWLFNESWGVDVAVSTPRLMSALVEEAVSVGDLVRLLRFSHGDANLVELTLPEESALAGTQVGARDFAAAWMGVCGFPTAWCLINPAQWYSYGSKHTGVVQFGMGDGSVQRVRRGIGAIGGNTNWFATDWYTFNRAGGFQDGEVFNLGDLGI